MDTRQLLFHIDSNLGQEEFQSLKFLCMDFISHKKLEKLKSCLDLFEELGRTHSLEENNFLISELIYLIGHYSLLRKLNTNRKIMEEELRVEKNVSFYRRMLFKLSENVTTDDQRQIVFLLKLPNKYSENKTFLDILCYLEKNEDISRDNLDVLEKAFRNISPSLLKMISNYKEKRSSHSEHDPDNLPLPHLSIQASPTDMVHSGHEKGTESILEYTQEVHELPNEQDLEAENQMCALNLEDQPIFSQIDDSHKFLHNSMQVYPMNQKHRGYCVIINNCHFQKSSSRQGTEKDAKDLKNVFTWLEFDVEVYDEKTSKEIRDIMKDFQNRDHTDRDCFVCCILTHGHSGAVLGTDDQVTNIKTIVSCFTPGNCSSLTGKPKLFFIQACQGEKNQNAHQIEADAEANAVSSAEKKKIGITVPDDADVLIGMSTVDGYYSYRHTAEGSWYIQALCSNLIKMVPRGEDVLSILTQVNKDVSEKEHKSNKLHKQMPQPSYTLRKKLVFPKPNTAFQENK